MSHETRHGVGHNIKNNYYSANFHLFKLDQFLQEKLHWVIINGFITDNHAAHLIMPSGVW